MASTATLRHSGPWADAAARFRASMAGWTGLAIVCLVLGASLLGPVVSPYDPVGGSLAERLQAPTVAHWLGTDLQGRDELSRLLQGGRITLVVGVAAVLIGLTVGCAIGGIAAIARRPVDGLLMRVVDVLLAFPSILLAIAVVSAMGRGIPQLIVAIGVAHVGNYARLLRSRLVSVQASEYVLAAEAVGVGRRRLLTRHLLPNSLTPVLVYSPLALATAITGMAGLGFLGLGPPDPRTPEWGSMLIESARFLRQAPHLLLFPGAAVVATVLGFNLLGDAAREALDPRLRS